MAPSKPMVGSHTRGKGQTIQAQLVRVVDAVLSKMPKGSGDGNLNGSTTCLCQRGLFQKPRETVTMILIVEGQKGISGKSVRNRVDESLTPYNTTMSGVNDLVARQSTRGETSRV